MKAFDADKQFSNMYTRSLLLESALQYFGMESVGDVPTRNIPPAIDPENTAPTRDWVNINLGNIVKTFVFPAWFGYDKEPSVTIGKFSYHLFYSIL